MDLYEVEMLKSINFESFCPLLILAALVTYAYLLFIGNYTTKNVTSYVILYVIASICIVPLMFRPRDPRNCKIFLLQTFIVAGLYGFRWKIRGKENMKKGSTGIILLNHQHIMDLLSGIYLTIVAEKIVPLMKYEFLYVFPPGLTLWLAGACFIKRSDKRQSYEKIDKTLDEIKENPGTKLFVFPEGTRNQDFTKTRKLLPFRKGAFAQAIKKQLPLFPIVCSPIHFINREKGLYKSGEMILEILPPIETTGLTDADVDDLVNKAQNIMQHAVDKLSAEVLDGIHKEK